MDEFPEVSKLWTRADADWETPVPVLIAHHGGCVDGEAAAGVLLQAFSKKQWPEVTLAAVTNGKPQDDVGVWVALHGSGAAAAYSPPSPAVLLYVDTAPSTDIISAVKLHANIRLVVLDHHEFAASALRSLAADADCDAVWFGDSAKSCAGVVLACVFARDVLRGSLLAGLCVDLVMAIAIADTSPDTSALAAGARGIKAAEFSQVLFGSSEGIDEVRRRGEARILEWTAAGEEAAKSARVVTLCTGTQTVVVDTAVSFDLIKFVTPALWRAGGSDIPATVDHAFVRMTSAPTVASYAVRVREPAAEGREPGNALAAVTALKAYFDNSKAVTGGGHVPAAGIQFHDAVMAEAAFRPGVDSSVADAK